MKILSQILGASARCDLLRVLHYLSEPAGLRQLARLAEIHPHSAERMLKDLVQEKSVLKTKSQTRPLYKRNSSHPDWQILDAVFTAVEQTRRKQRNPELNKRAKTILPFIEEAGKMLKHAKRSTDVP